MLAFAAASSAAASANSNSTLPDLASIRRLARDLHAAPTCAVAGGVHGALGGAGSHLQVGEGSSSDLAEAEFVQLSMAASVEGCAVRARRDIADSAAHEVLDMLQTEWATQLIKTLGQTIVMQILSPFILSFVTALMPAINEMLTPQVVSGCRDPLVSALSTTVEMNIGISVTNMLEPTLHAKLGTMLSRSLAWHLPRVLGRELPPQLSQFAFRVVAPRAGKELAHRLVHTLTHSLTHSIASELEHTIVSGVTKALGHLLVHYYFCVYCFTTGDYCGHCSSYNQFQRVAPGGQSGNLGRYAQKGKPAG